MDATLPIGVDTNIVSYLFKRDTRAALYRSHLQGRVPVISFMTIAELDAWAEVNRWGAKQRERLERFLDGYLVHYPDREACRLWAGVFAETRTRGKPIQTADAWIATMALLYGVPLITHNAADFAGVDGLQLITEPGP
jgi:predicted nucleic acid-binding protein